MQLGTENRNKTIAAIALAIVALVMVVVRFFPSSPASAKTPTPVVAPPVGAQRTRCSKARATEKIWHCARTFT